MTTVSVIEAGREFAGTLRRMEAGHEAVIVKRGRKAVAVLVPPDMIEALEDIEDVREADRVLANIRAGRENTIPLKSLPKIPAS